MNVEALREQVVPKVKERLAGLKNVDVTEIIPDKFGGAFVVVRSDSMVEHEELAYVYPGQRVRLFDTTEELLHFIDDQSRKSWFDRIFARPVLSGIIMLILLAVLAIAGLLGASYNGAVIEILGSVVTLAAGFFFGSQKGRA